MREITDAINFKIKEAISNKGKIISDAYSYSFVRNESNEIISVQVILLSAFEEVKGGKFIFSLEELRMV